MQINKIINKNTGTQINSEVTQTLCQKQREITSILLPCNYQLGKSIVNGYSCHVNIDNLPYSDRYFNTDWQLEMFKRGKPMDMILV